MAYVPLTNFPPRFVDANGDAISGGSVEFYLSGTSTAANVYSDTAGTVAGTTITLDSRGEFETIKRVFGDTGVTYKAVVKDSEGVIVPGQTIDPIYPPIDNVAVRGVAGAQVANLVALRALTGGQLSGSVFMLCRTSAGDGGEGRFVWRSGDQSANVTADPSAGIYVPPNSDATGTSGCWVRVYDGALMPEWFGAGADKTAAENAIAAQATIDATVETAGTVNFGAISLRGGDQLDIGSQIELDQKSVVVHGNNALLKWQGANTEAMLHVMDSERCFFNNLVLLGNYDAPPTAAFYFEAPSPAVTEGTNRNLVIQGCILGRRFATDTTTGGLADTTPAGRLQSGIVVGGATDGDNAEYAIRDTQVHNCDDVGVDFQNTQSIWTRLDKVLVNNSGTGFRLGCNMTLHNVACNRNSVADIEGIRNIEVWVKSYESEHSELAIWSKAGASFFVDGGKILTYHETDGNVFQVDAGGTLSIQNLLYQNVGAGSRKVYYRSGSAKDGAVIIKECSLANGGLRDTYDIHHSHSTAVKIDIEHGDFRFKTTRTYLDVAVTPPSVAAGVSDRVASGSANTPWGEFWNTAYQYDHQQQHITPAFDSTGQIRARIFNPTAAAVQLGAGRMRWMNLGNHIKAIGSATVDAPLMATSTGYTATISVPGARLGDFVTWSAGAQYLNWVVAAYVSADDTVSLRIHNATGGNSDPASTTLYAARLADFGNYQAGLMEAGATITSGSTVTRTVSVPGAQLGGHTFVAFTKDLAGLLVTAYVSAADTVTILASNYTGSDVTLPAGAWKVMVAF